MTVWFLLACSKCGSRETILVTEFDKLGNAVRVKCSCGNHFVAIMERASRHSQTGPDSGVFFDEWRFGPCGFGTNNVWGPMMVVDLSKHGPPFLQRKKSHLISTGSLLTVRFNLDNANQALIHKMVRGDYPRRPGGWVPVRGH